MEQRATVIVPSLIEAKPEVLSEVALVVQSEICVEEAIACPRVPLSRIASWGLIWLCFVLEESFISASSTPSLSNSAMVLTYSLMGMIELRFLHQTRQDL